jgi:hypothetical protein
MLLSVMAKGVEPSRIQGGDGVHPQSMLLSVTTKDVEKEAADC